MVSKVSTSSSVPLQQWWPTALMHGVANRLREVVLHHCSALSAGSHSGLLSRRQVRTFGDWVQWKNHQMSDSVVFALPTLRKLQPAACCTTVLVTPPFVSESWIAHTSESWIFDLVCPFTVIWSVLFLIAYLDLRLPADFTEVWLWHPGESKLF